MNKIIAIEKEKAILEAYSERLSALGNDAQISTAQENGFADILSVEYETGAGLPVLAQYHFIPPVDEEADFLLFSQSLTISDSIEGEDLKLMLLQAVNVVNYLLPFGYFGFDLGLGILSYRHTSPVPVEISAQAAEDYLSKFTLQALGQVITFASPLLSLADGTVDWDGFLAAAGAVADHYAEAADE